MVRMSFMYWSTVTHADRRCLALYCGVRGALGKQVAIRWAYASWFTEGLRRQICGRVAADRIAFL